MRGKKDSENKKDIRGEPELRKKRRPQELRIMGTMLGTHARITRGGKFRDEFLLQRQLIKVSTRGGTQQVMICEDPVGLQKGKTALHVFVAGCEMRPTLRHLGHRGVVVNWYCQGGQLHLALSRLYKSRHALFYGEEAPVDQPRLGASPREHGVDRERHVHLPRLFQCNEVGSVAYLHQRDRGSQPHSDGILE